MSFRTIHGQVINNSGSKLNLHAYASRDSNLILVHFQTHRKLIFGPARTNEGESKAGFRTVYQSRDHELFENSILIHVH